MKDEGKENQIGAKDFAVFLNTVVQMKYHVVVIRLWERR